MIIGVDFDNTIVCYDGIFHRVALERGLIPENLPLDKTSVRNHLRQIGREADWTEMQGQVYGPRLIEAQPYPGVLDFFREAVRQGVELRIISHKTKHPFLGEQHDLHAFAWGWLDANGFFDGSKLGMKEDQVFFELTKESKHQRIAQCECTHFIDDLPEFLLDPGFPATIERILFDPKGFSNGEWNLRSAQSWGQIASELLADPHVLELGHRLLGKTGLSITHVSGGANNRLCRIQSASAEIVVKAYHHSDSDRRDRFAAERDFYSLKPSQTATPLAWDADNRLGAFTALSGRKLAPSEVSEIDVDQCIKWFCGLQNLRNHPEAKNVGLAADACPATEDHIELLQRRVRRLLETECAHHEFRTFVTEELARQCKKIIERIDISLPKPPLVLSPSDFGFHNALKDASGRLWFFDFEYAGWDDPAKLLCDFFCQPQIPVSIEHADRFVSAVQQITREATLPSRFKTLLPLHAAKWACILLNEFLKTDVERRRFAGIPDRQDAQLEKARQMLQKSLSFL